MLNEIDRLENQGRGPAKERKMRKIDWCINLLLTAVVMAALWYVSK